MIFFVDGLLWLRSGLGKVAEGKFAESLPLILKKFASENPYPFYKQLLLTTGIPYAKTLAGIIMWGEVISALAILFSVISLFIRPNANYFAERTLVGGLLIGLILNTNFWFGGGWTSASTESINLLMAAIEAIGIATLVKGWFTK